MILTRRNRNNNITQNTTELLNETQLYNTIDDINISQNTVNNTPRDTDIEMGTTLRNRLNHIRPELNKILDEDTINKMIEIRLKEYKDNNEIIYI